MMIEQRIPPQNIRINNNYINEVLYEPLHHIHILSSNQEISDYVNVTVTWSQTQQEREMFKYWLQDRNMSRILFFHDSIERQKKKGGRKTWLLKNCQDIVMQYCQELIIVSTDFLNILVFYDTYESIEQNRNIAIIRFLQKIPNIHQNELAINLPTLSFVRKSNHGENFVLHDEMRCVVIECCWENVDLTKHRYKKRSRKIIDSYSQEWVHTQNKRLMKLLFSDSSISLILRNSIRCYKEYLILLLINLNCLASENLTVLRNGVFVCLSRETNILLTNGKPVTKWDTEEAFFQYEHKPILALYRLFCCHLRNEKQEQLAIQSFEMKKPQNRVQEALEQ